MSRPAPPLAAGLVAGAARLLAGASGRNLGPELDRSPRVYFANHTSHLDFVVLWSVLPPAVRASTRPVAAKEYWESGAIRRHFAADVFRAVLVSRESTTVEEKKQQVARMDDALAAGESLILFPEGTRGTGDGVAPFRSGLFHLASGRPGVPLVPVFVENLNRILPKGEFLPVPLLSRVTLGAPIRIGANEPKADFLARARDAVVALGDRR